MSKEIVCYQYTVHDKPVYGRENKPRTIFGKPDRFFDGTKHIGNNQFSYPVVKWSIKPKNK